MGKAIRESSIGTRLGKKFQIGNECSFVNQGKGLFLSVYVEDIKLTGKKQNMSPNVENSNERS